MSQKVRLASVNVNGIRAAHRKGMDLWLAGRGIDILTLQEVRAGEADLGAILPDWHICADVCSIPGRAGVAIASKFKPAEVRTHLPADESLNTSGRWIEADYEIDGQRLTVSSCYVYSGEAGTVKQEEKMLFLQALEKRMAELSQQKSVVVTGDFNIAHRTLDLKNWRGNLKKSGFLPEEKAYLDKLIGNEQDPRYNQGAGQGWIDVGRQQAGEAEGPYTWWSMRGQAFDNDTGWRIDYQFARPNLKVLGYTVDRPDSYAQRWTDHAPVVVDYLL